MTTISKTTIRTLLGAAALAGLVSTLAAPASAAVTANGRDINGTSMNGSSMNGTSLNGGTLKGTPGAPVVAQDRTFDFGSVTLVGVTPPPAVAQ